MKVVAQQGDSVFIVQLDDSTARVVDLQSMLAYPPTGLQAILKHGYWEPPTAPKKDQDAAVALAKA